VVESTEHLSLNNTLILKLGEITDILELERGGGEYRSSGLAASGPQLRADSVGATA